MIAAPASARLAGFYSDLTGFFIPHSVSEDREATNQARMFLLSHFLGPFLGLSVPIAFLVVDPTPGWDIAVLAVSILSFWLFPPLLKAGFSYRSLVLLSIAIDWFVIFWSCYFYGGIASPTLSWLLIIPILAVFYIGGERRMQRDLLIISCIAIAVFAIVFTAFPPAQNDVPGGAMILLGATSTIAVGCYVALMAVYYARIFDAGVDLETEVKRRHSLANELRKAVVAANRASSAKSEFLARMSHELRTPLNAIIGYGQLLKEEAEDTRDDHLLQDVSRILDAGHYLVRLINMILDLSKLEAGRMEFDPRPHALEPLIEGIVADRQAMIEAAGNRIELRLERAPDAVEVDGNRLRDILDSILENAAHHTRDGTVAISAQSDRRGDLETFSIAVSDTGPGIRPEILSTIFETFSTSRDAAGGQYGGTGLNLTVSSRLCRAMGGEIAVQSTPGAGSTFTLTLPLRSSAAAGSRGPSSSEPAAHPQNPKGIALASATRAPTASARPARGSLRVTHRA